MTTTLPTKFNRKQRLATSPLQARARRILDREISFIPHRGFARLKPESAAAPLPLATVVQASDEAPARTHLSALFQAPLLSIDDERALFRRMNFLKYCAVRLRSQLIPSRPRRSWVDEIERLLRSAEECRGRLVESNLRLVASIAGRFSGSAVDFDELLCEGNVVLVRCVDKFDFSRGFRFSTYATNSIQRHLYRVIARRRRQIRRESAANDLLNHVVAAREPDASQPPPVSRQEIDGWLSHLDPRSRSIVVARFDLAETGKRTTLRAVSEDVGLSKERVRQLQFQALAKLRDGIPRSIAVAWE